MKRILPLVVVLIVCLIAWSFIAVSNVRPDAHYKQGAVVSYVIVAPDKSIRKSNSTITSVTVTGDQTRFTFKTIYLNEINDTGSVSYAYCFMNKKNFWQQLKGAYYGSMIFEVSETMQGDSLVYPFDMKIGDTLPTGYRKNTFINPWSSGVSNSFYFNRRVTAIDTIPTPLGKIPCFRVESKESHYSKYDYPKMKDHEEYTEIILHTTWFSPEYGIVKEEWVKREGKYKMVLQSIK